MTVNAHLIKTINLQTTDDEIILEKILERTATFNSRRDYKILKLFLDYGGDNTNDDLNGELTMDKETWSNILNELDYENLTPDELKIIKKITNDLSDDEIVFYECF